MIEVFRCEDKDTLVAYLYGEVDGDVRREVERHLRTCAACARETEGLHDVRQDLQLWTPPEPEFGFSIVQNTETKAAARVLTSSRWAVLHELPAWAQIAAAAVFIAAAASLANLQVRSTTEGLIVTTGWMQAPAAGPMASPNAAQDVGAQLAALEESLRQEFRAELAARVSSELQAQQSAMRTAMAVSPPVGESANVMRRVQSMIDASEERQRQEMALRFAQAERTWNVRWTSDRATLNRQLGNLQGRTMAVQAGQQEIMNSIRLQRVSAPQPNQ